MMTRTWEAIRRAVGIDEVLITASLTLVTVGFWTWLGLGALVLPGLVLLWIVLPGRRPFITRPDQDAGPPRRRRA